MPVVTRRRGVRVLVVVAAAFPLLLAGGAALLTVVIGGTCSGSGIGDAPSALAIRDIPAGFLRIYEQVGAQFKIPWEVLAGIGKEECDHGRDPDPSCTPQPGARGPGVANCCGASGPMQIGIGGASTDNYDKLRHYLPDPVAGAARSDHGRRARRAVPDQARRRAHRATDRRLPGGDPRLQPRPRRTSTGCWPTRTPTRAPGPRRSALRAARRWARRWCPGRRRGSCRAATRPPRRTLRLSCRR